MSSEERAWKFRIRDILDAIQRIQQYTQSLTYQQFVDSPMVIDAVARNFITIGEAVRHIPRQIQEAYPNIPWRAMYGMRNALAHEYDRVSLRRVWNTVEENLPKLPDLLREVLKDQGE
ncbi:MAG: DUF86 domain-containing protein [Chloroflexi bacterium]|nr:DUF86 domain-containing protein [Chloroflexota bacterium]